MSSKRASVLPLVWLCVGKAAGWCPALSEESSEVILGG
jgi:hypothetical protein